MSDKQLRSILEILPRLEVVYGYKGFDKVDEQLMCRDHVFSLTEPNVHNGEIQMCERGFHFCRELSPVLQEYYRLDSNSRVYYKVRAIGKVIEIGDKCVTDKLEILEECKEEVYLEAVKLDGFAIRFIPQGYWTNELMLAAVKSNGWALQFIPQKFRSNELMLEAVKSRGGAIQFIPEEYRTEKIMLESTKSKSI